MKTHWDRLAGDVDALSGAVQDTLQLNGGPGAYEADEQLIIALDFGTTFSGIAFCFPNQQDTKVASIVDWPGGESAPKIQTLISYDAKDTNKFSWGASVNRMSDSIIGIKLLLDPSQERPLYLPTGNLQRDIRKLPKKPVNVAADFIHAIYQHALTEITKMVPQGYMSLCQKKFVLSVPAVWSDAAKQATLEAAKMAGIFPVTLIKEPEAAALYTLHSLDFALNVGDAFVVCDAGGGTVDLISYEIVAITPTLQLKELVPGTGGMAGSLGLNQRFLDAVKNLVGEDQYHELRKTKGYWLAERCFDREIKKAYRGDPNEEYFVTFPMADLEDDRGNGLVSNTWRMTGKDMEAIFAPLITDILRLIDDQVKSVKIKRPDKGITGICLVGGFGSSQYLKACVEKEHPNVQVLQPNDAWAAIAKGAALSSLPRKASVISTSSTKHYGIELWEIKDDGKDGGQPTQNWRDGTTRVAKVGPPIPPPRGLHGRWVSIVRVCLSHTTSDELVHPGR
ncbi:putative hsp70 protein [Cercophora newfieldiana]|uniref:Hsp70 protein n=1 Tax=Cercophora newfieldiana TaxID=92897 RepID=A0AA40CRF0_9PEZI|nr:putative hsp70 protein [Cercophora newfieldiana]